MRLLFVNPVHPDAPHISAVRMWQFACALARRSHQVAVVTPRDAHDDECDLSIPALSTRVANHDWTQPFRIPLPILARPATRKGQPAVLRRLATAWRFVVHGGPDPAWSHSVAAHSAAIAEALVPELVWGTFGDSSNITAAKRLARDGRCPWVLDLKDNWELYVPQGLRHFMVWRTSGWAAMTANAEWTRNKARKWQRGDAALVYSGVADAFLDTTRKPEDIGTLDLNLVGSLYNGDRLHALLAGIRAWMNTLETGDQERVRIHYLGSDRQLFTDIAKPMFEARHLVNHGYMDVASLALLCRSAWANFYIRHEGTFHHKLLELLAVGRPVIAYPTESNEAHALARSVGGHLIAANNPEAVQHTLARLAIADSQPARSPAGTHTPDAFGYSWDTLAERLESAFSAIAIEAAQ